jgi:hypothetical protein
MRSIRTVTFGLLSSLPLLLPAAPALAETSDFMGQAQRLMNMNNRGDDRDSYDRGRDDEARRQAAQLNRDGYRRDNDREDDRDRRDDRSRQPDYGNTSR